jgi:hypothetical protein
VTVFIHPASFGFFIFIYLLLHAPLHCVILHAGYTLYVRFMLVHYCRYFVKAVKCFALILTMYKTYRPAKSMRKFPKLHVIIYMAFVNLTLRILTAVHLEISFQIYRTSDNFH